MAAIIELQDGLRATYANGRWECSERSVQEVLRLTTEMLPWRYRPWPEADIAADVAAQIGARVISVDPPPDNHAPDDAMF